MTEKRYTFHELVNGDYSIDETTYEKIYDETHTFYHRICIVNRKKEAEKLCDLLNALHEENECLKEKLCELGISDVKCYGKIIDTGLEEWLE